MKALTYKIPSSRGAKPEIYLVDQPVPVPGKGELLVRVHYAGLSNFDQENASGHRNSAMARALKKSTVISGIEMSGVAETDGIRVKAGDTVFAYTHIWRGPYFHAEYVSVPEQYLARVPDNHTLEGTASIVGGALTSINGLERIAKLKAGENVLITGATGSVGVTGVQLAAHKGARVSAVCHSSQEEFAVSQGAAEVYAYDRNELPPANNQFDLVFDTAPSLSFSAVRAHLKGHGRYVSTMPHLDLAGSVLSLFSRKKWGFLLEYDTDKTRMERLRTLLSEDAFMPAIDTIYEASAAKEAFDRQQRPGKRGKILIDFRHLQHSDDLDSG